MVDDSEISYPCEIKYKDYTHRFLLFVGGYLHLTYDVNMNDCEDDSLDISGTAGRAFGGDVRQMRKCLRCNDICIGKCGKCMLEYKVKKKVEKSV